MSILPFSCPKYVAVHLQINLMGGILLYNVRLLFRFADSSLPLNGITGGEGNSHEITRDIEILQINWISLDGGDIIWFYEDGYIYVREKEIALFRGTGLCGFFHKAQTLS